MLPVTATLAEILDQPKVWDNVSRHMASLNIEALLHGMDAKAAEWVFVGCGTSYYLAQAAAASLASLLGARARAVPASELILFPTSAMPANGAPVIPVLISRSGHTSEVLQAAAYLRSAGVDFLAITCDGRELGAATSRVLKLPIHEDSTVMTASFTGMLLALQYLAATLAKDGAFTYALNSLSDHLGPLLARYTDSIERFASTSFEDVVFLGQGVLYPIASETALKVMESSSTYAQYYHTLEFRHGPKSIAGPETLIGALISETGSEWEIPVLREMKQLGATTMAVANTATDDLRGSADLLIEMNLPVPELARTAMYVVWGQLLGTFRGLAKGLNPDAPQNLDRVVTI